MGRHLAAILTADVVGYSRAMGADERGTLELLKSHRRELIEPKSAQYGGRTIKLMGDGALMEFASAVDAVIFAVEVQMAMRERNAALLEDKRLEFRIGINVGDVIVEDDDIYGDGVNIAARIEGLAEPGGVCVHDNVQHQVRDKLALDYKDMGEVRVKNIERPVRAFQIVMNEKAEALVTPIVFPKDDGRMKRRYFVSLVGLLLFAVAGFALLGPWGWGESGGHDHLWPEHSDDRPSIAVLPFDNLSNDPDQEYFADGITEDVITDLSKISSLMVIARNSTFAYKDSPKDLREVGEELGAHYLLEGSVQRAGEQVRINAQLIDGETGGHLWAERYDGELEDVFSLQDQVTEKIVAALELELTEGEQEHSAQTETVSHEAYDAFLQGWSHYRRRTPEDYAQAIKFFEEAIDLDPNYSRAYAALAATYWDGWERSWHKELGFDDWLGPRREAERYLETALKDPTALAHQVHTKVKHHEEDHDHMVEEAKQAIQHDPNDPNSYIAMALALFLSGDPENALAAADEAMKLDPQHPAYYLYLKGLAEFSLENFEKSVEYLERSLELNPENMPANIFLIAAQAHLGDTEAAKARLEAHPEPLSLDWVDYYWHFRKPEDRERLLKGLRLADTPEAASLFPPPPKSSGIATNSTSE